MKTTPLIAAGVAGILAASAAHAAPEVSYHYAQVDDVRVFYREAGDPSAPTIVLLHGLPSSSFMYRELIPMLADRYHVIAPDLPGFGYTEAPERGKYAYTFAQLAKTMDRFTEVLKLKRYALQVFDYGAPVGWRLALAHPERVTAIVSQNGNAYEEGFGEMWAPLKAYWNDPSQANRDALRGMFTADSIKWQYTHGAPDPMHIAPETYTIDNERVSRPGNLDIQLDLILDYKENVVLYPQFQQYFRTHQPPLLAVWGRNDAIFVPAGAEAWKRDLPKAQIHFYDTGHFALETHVREIGPVIHQFLDANVPRGK
ncbi:MAG: Haloalkane dehalogenase [Stenotrophomonas maltophilia]|uniref:Haloalkane dehalogenase n=1 Tax=Stenotrophomonas maltophilia TaxID=40324 RepID=A0A7V8FJY7_STEMA|nr:MAG: Haloalkane dehalogenase [Stenotrophomonas maltophilia]